MEAFIVLHQQDLCYILRVPAGRGIDSLLVSASMTPPQRTPKDPSLDASAKSKKRHAHER